MRSLGMLIQIEKYSTTGPRKEWDTDRPEPAVSKSTDPGDKMV